MAKNGSFLPGDDCRVFHHKWRGKYKGLLMRIGEVEVGKESANRWVLPSGEDARHEAEVFPVLPNGRKWFAGHYGWSGRCP